MNEIWDIVLALAAGGVLGTFFFAGLWWTIRKGISSERLAVWFLGSWLLRTSVTVSGFVLIARGDSVRLLACLLGFVLARPIVIRLTRDTPNVSELATEAGHAS